MSDPSPDDVYTVSITVLDGTVQAMDLNGAHHSSSLLNLLCVQLTTAQASVMPTYVLK